MSTILKALRRLEQEKSSQADRPLGEAVANTPPPPAPSSSRTPWLIAGGSLVGAFAVTAVALLLFRGDPEPAPETATIAQAPTQAAAGSKRERSPAVAPTRRVARAAPRTDSRGALPRPVRSETAGEKGLSPAALSSPDVEVVALPGPPAVADEVGVPEAVDLRRREPPRPGAGVARPPAEAAAVVPPVAPTVNPARTAAVAESPRESVTEPVVVAAAPTAPPKREPRTSPSPEPKVAPKKQPTASSPRSEPKVATKAAAESIEPEFAVPPAPKAAPKNEPTIASPTSEPMAVTKAAAKSAEREAAVPPAPSGESKFRTDRTPPLTPPVTKSPPRPAAPVAKAPVEVAAVAPQAKQASPPRPAAKPDPAPPKSAPTKPRETLKALPAPTKSSTARSAASPDVYVERTVWHPLADRRVAMVSLGEGTEAVELHEGDALGPFVVGEIEPTGVFFQRGDEELRRRVGAR